MFTVLHIQYLEIIGIYCICIVCCVYGFLVELKVSRKLTNVYLDGIGPGQRRYSHP